MRLGQRTFLFELLERLLDVVLCEAHEPEEPVQPERRIAFPSRDLAILHRGAMLKDAFRFGQMTARDMDHRGLEVREREIRVERGRRGAGPQALVAPCRVA